MPGPRRIPPKKGQESAWDYPRPPAVRLVAKHIQVWCDGERVADTRRAFKVMETSHPPTYYIPREDVVAKYLRKSATTSVCEFRGTANYYSVRCHSGLKADACWTYLEPKAPYRMLAGYLCFYAQKMAECLVDGEKVTPQPGEFYGGWITKDVVGPFKGEPGTEDW